MTSKNKVDEIKLGILGLGNHIGSYMKIIKAHPKITYVVAAEQIETRRTRYSEHNVIQKVYSSFDEMLEQDKEINCIAVYSQRHQHGLQIIKALKAGKHVMCAVPRGVTVDEIKEIIRLVEEKDLIFMMFETCYYWPCAVWAREKFKTGKFGQFVYGAAQYYHTIQGMTGSFNNGADTSWKRVAGVPPMYYATHSIGMLFSAINDHATKVSCFGFKDTINPDIYGEGVNDWDNPFSNETAIFTMSNGGYTRINEFRRVGSVQPNAYISGIYGSDGTYENSGGQHLFASSGTSLDSRPIKDYICEDVSDEINTLHYAASGAPRKDVGVRYSFHCGFSPVQNYQRLPKELLMLNNKCLAEKDFGTTGHNGSHFLLLDDFVRCCITGKQPFLNAWASARYTIPGIIAHDSAMQGWISLDIPDFGDMPDAFELLDYNDLNYN